jgi:hypothetical protein
MSLTAGNLYVSSYNNQDNETSTNFSITLAVPVSRAKKIRVLAATIANLMMPFGINDKFWQFSINNVQYSMNFPTDQRWATMTDFLTFVNSTLFPGATAPGTTTPATPVPATMSYDASTNKLTITSTNPAHVITMPAWNWNNPTATSVAYNANYRLGWTENFSVSGTHTLTADGFPNVFQRTNNIYITSNISTDSNNDANVGNIIGKVAVNVAWGGLIIYENVHSDFASPCFSESIKSVHILLLDEDYQVLRNPGNAYFNVQLGIEY